MHLRTVLSFATGLVAVALTGCDGDSTEADVRGARLWDAPYVRSLTLPEVVDSVIASGQEGFEPQPESVSRPEDGERIEGGAEAPARHPATASASEPGVQRAPELPLKVDLATSAADEMPRYDWVMDSTSTADN